MTQYNYKHIRFYTRSLEKAKGSVLVAFSPHLSPHKKTLMLPTPCSWITEISTASGLEEKSQFQITAQKLEGKQPAYVSAALPLTNSNFGKLTGT